MTDINNEVRVDEKYKRNLAKLEKIVLVMFSEDTVVNPPESAWFGAMNETTGAIIPVQQQPIYQRLGLDDLEARGSLHFELLPGDHSNLILLFGNTICGDTCYKLI